MRTVQSDYMHWAKFKPPTSYSLTASEVPHFRIDSLPVGIADLELDGASHPRYRPLRNAIARRYDVAADQVVTADGTSMANFVAMATLISPGDEVLVEQPTYELLLGAASFLGANIKRFARKAAEGFRLNPAIVQDAMSDRTRLIILTNLHNPSSALAKEPELRAIGELASSVGAQILIDEVYLDSAASPQKSAVHLGPEFVSTNSLTKVYGLSGLRCGWILAKPELAERMWRLNDLFGVNQAHPAERLACIAFENIDRVIGDGPAMLARNRQRWNSFVEARGDLECFPSEHGITAFPRWLGGETKRLDDHLRERYDSSVVPGRWFEMPEHFRVGFGMPTAQFQEALARLAACLEDLQ